MSKIYIGQIAARIVVDCVIDITEAGVRRIHYRKPGGDEGWLDAFPYGDSKTEIFADVWEESFLNEPGIWHFWAYVQWGSAEKVVGQTARLRLYER